MTYYTIFDLVHVSIKTPFSMHSLIFALFIATYHVKLVDPLPSYCSFFLVNSYKKNVRIIQINKICARKLTVIRIQIGLGIGL